VRRKMNKHQLVNQLKIVWVNLEILKQASEVFSKNNSNPTMDIETVGSEKQYNLGLIVRKSTFVTFLSQEIKHFEKEEKRIGCELAALLGGSK
jgi:hypothetical protein